MAGFAAKVDLKDIGELGAYFKGRVKIEESVVVNVYFKENFANNHDPRLVELGRDLERKYNGISVNAKENSEGKVIGLTIWVNLKR